MKNLIIAAFICVSSSYGVSQTLDVRKANLQVANDILSTIKTCGSSIWPGFDLKKINFVFVDETSDELVGLSMASNEILKLNKSQFPESSLKPAFSIFNVGQQQWLAVNTHRISLRKGMTFESMVDEAFRLAVHEAFHWSMQDDWITPDVRGTLVPIKWEPRFYRAMIYNNLLLAFGSLADESAALSRARYWFDRWAKDYKEETTMVADGYEGTAQYSDMMADAFLKKGCSGGEAELTAYLLTTIPEQSTGATSGYRFSLDGEGYEIGLLSSLLLRRQRVPDWFGEVAKGITPLEQLMSAVKPEFEATDDVFKSIFVATQAKEQTKVDGFLGDTYKAMAEADEIYINIPNAWRATRSFSPYGFYVDPALNISLTPMAIELDFGSPDTKSKLKSLQRAVFLTSEGNPCGHGLWNFVLPVTDVVAQTDNRLEIKNKFFFGTLSGKMMKDSKGQNWFCAGE